LPHSGTLKMDNIEISKYFVDDFAKLMAAETYKLMKHKEKEVNLGTTEAFMVATIKHLVNHTLLHVLTSKRYQLMEKAQINKAIYKDYLKIKNDLENGIADGFNMAVLGFSPETPIDYFCLVRDMGKPANKEKI
jgi:hypothetical protein